MSVLLRLGATACVLLPVLVAPDLRATDEPAASTLYDALANPEIVGVLPAPGLIAIGRAEIRPTGGRLYRLAAAGRPCGYLIDSPATLTYRVEDRFSQPVARRNLKEAHGVHVAAEAGLVTLTATVDAFAVWGWDLDLGEGAPVTDAEAKGLPKWLRAVLVEKFDDNPQRDMLLSQRNGEAGFRWAVFHGSDDLVLDVDPRPFVGVESLLRYEAAAGGRGDLSGRRFAQVLATQPLGTTWLQGHRVDFLGVHSAVTVVNPAADRVEVTSRSRFDLRRDGIRLLHLSLLTETYDEAGQARPYAVTRLTLNGRPAPYIHRSGNLFVELPEPSHSGDAVVIDVTSAGAILMRPAGDSYWTLGVGNWYVRPGPGGLEGAEIQLDVSVAAPFVPITVGELVERTSAAGVNHVRTRLRAPMEHAVVLAGRYSTLTDEDKGLRVHVSTYAGGKEYEAKRLARVIPVLRACYEDWFGVPYPFQDLQVIEINQWGWGQAPPGAIFLTKDAFLSPARANLHRDDADGLAYLTGGVMEGVVERIAHELAHAYFPHVAKIARVEENWLSESLAEYASAYCLAETKGGQKGQSLFEHKRAEWRRWSDEVGDDASVFLAAYLAPTERNATARRHLLYGRGPLIIQAVRERLEGQHGQKEGRRLFLTWIRSYVKNFTFKVAETRHLVAILEQLTGQAWMAFFERHLLGTESPPVK